MQPKLTDRLTHDRGPVGGGATPAIAGAEILDQHLGEEVVRGRKHQSEQRGERRRFHAGQCGRAAGRGGGGRAAAVRDGDVRALQAERQLLCGVGSRCVRSVERASFATVESKAGEIAFKPGVECVAAGRLSAQQVEVGLIAEHAAGDAVDAVVVELGDQGGDACALSAVVPGDERAGAERRISAAAQVEVAFPHPAACQLAGAVDGRGQARRGPHLHQRCRGGVELLHRGGRVHFARAVGVKRRACGDVVDVGA